MSSPPVLIGGEVDFLVTSIGKTSKTKYWVSGDLKSSSSKTPLVVAHGGPGAGHNYLADLALLTASHGIPVVLYDQIGGGESTHFPEKNGDGEFWSVQLFIDELHNLLGHLSIQDNFHLLGHSWGGMLGASVAVQQPKGLRRLVLSSSVPRMQDWITSANMWKEGLPEDVKNTINKHEADGTTDSKEYEEAMGVFYERHLCRVVPMPEGLAKDLAKVAEEPTVYNTMNGPSEFFITGTLKTFDIRADLHKINVPTLVTNGRYDGARDFVQQPFFDNIPHVKWVEFAESSHTPLYEEKERYLKVIGDFLAA